MGQWQDRWDRGRLLALPAFESLRPVLLQCPEQRFPEAADLDALAAQHGVLSGGGAPLRFVDAEVSARRDFDSRYEVRIYREGAVPTRRANWHDLFNALAWISFPRTKAALNRRHFLEMQAGDGGRPRTRARDVLTLFDESGIVVVCADPALARLLREFRWKDLFWTGRGAVNRAMGFFIFGHAILEKALRPYKGVTAKALILDVEERVQAQPLQARLVVLDTIAAAHFSGAEALSSTRSLSPLPVFGVPGWDAGNEVESFYDDAAVFRPGRRARDE
jgi:hypothetical protein